MPFLNVNEWFAALLHLFTNIILLAYPLSCTGTGKKTHNLNLNLKIE